MHSPEFGRAPSKALRVLHGPSNIGNQAWVVSRAERSLGLLSDLVVTSQSWTQYPADRLLAGRSRIGSALSRIAFAFTAPFRYDAIHYYFGRLFAGPESVVAAGGVRSWMGTAEIRLARLLGRRCVMTLQGCDARIAARSLARDPSTMCRSGRCGHYALCVAATDRRRLGMMDSLLPLMDHVFYVNPELGHELPDATFLPYGNVDIRAVEQRPPSETGRPLIVHAPTDPAIKGTPAILAALETMKAHYDFDLEIISGRPHQEAMELFRRADLAIDQIHAGWYGGFAVELMAMAKPVACGIRESDLRFIPPAMAAKLPVLRLRPGRLEDDLSAILATRNSWRERGLQSRAYVESWHDPEWIAGILQEIYDNNLRHGDVKKKISMGRSL